MPKRFTDSDKWKKPFIKALPLHYKLLWFYMLDDCNHAGIWQEDLEVASIRIGYTFKKEEVIKVFKDKIKVFDNGSKWFIKDFVDFQYGTLNENIRAHKSVINILNKYDLLNDNDNIKVNINLDKVDEYITKIKGEEMFLEGLYRMHKLKNRTISKIVLKFKEHLKIYPKDHKNFLEFRNHFGSWVGHQIKNGNFNEYLKQHKGQL